MDTRPTNSELEILAVLWKRGPSSVRDVYEELEKKHRTGYTTVLKLMQIMAEKGLVTRDEQNRAHIYSAKPAEAETQRNLVDDLAERAFGGSAYRLALHALGSKKSTPEEIAEIRRLLDALEENS
jgi:predicted transcriptional regulator